jgi:hypothetical protein
MNAALVIGQNSFTTLTPATSQIGLSIPTGIEFDKQGNLWVADHGNNRVLRYPPPFTDGIPADLVIGQGQVNGQPSFTTDTRALTQNGLLAPVAVAIGFDTETQPFEQSLWVSDYGNGRVLEFRQARPLHI